MKRFDLRQNPINGQFYMAESPTGEYVEYASLSHAAGQEVVAWTDQRGLERLREGKQELVSGTKSAADPVALYTHPCTCPSGEVDTRRPSDASIVRAFRDACAADLQQTGKRHRELQRIYDTATRLDDIASSETHGGQDCSPVSDPAPSE